MLRRSKDSTIASHVRDRAEEIHLQFEAKGLSGYLFQHNGNPIYGNTLRSYAENIGKVCEIRFSMTKCRAT